ncbi:gag-asp proteas multi-domain protein [Pyrenophora tritici-repentis]|nr:gag-asp proteas multi-domain protein [Pyrenophora tritici-repentis]
MVKGKQLVQGQQFVFKCKVATSNSYIDTEALTDSGATGNCISTLFAQRHNLPTFRLKQPLQLRLGDGNFAMAPITHGVLAPISHAEHVSEELFYSVPMTTYDFIFGTSWLEEHNPHIDWRKNYAFQQRALLRQLPTQRRASHCSQQSTPTGRSKSQRTEPDLREHGHTPCVR